MGFMSDIAGTVFGYMIEKEQEFIKARARGFAVGNDIAWNPNSPDHRDFSDPMWPGSQHQDLNTIEHAYSSAYLYLTLPDWLVDQQLADHETGQAEAGHQADSFGDLWNNEVGKRIASWMIEHDTRDLTILDKLIFDAYKNGDLYNATDKYALEESLNSGNPLPPLNPRWIAPTPIADARSVQDPDFTGVQLSDFFSMGHDINKFLYENSIISIPTVEDIRNASNIYDVLWDMSSRIISYAGFTSFHLDESIIVEINSHKSVITGTSTADYITSGPGGSIVHGNGGDDVIHGRERAEGSAASFLYGDAGNDSITMASADWSFGGDGDDTLISSLTGGHLSGDGGNDQISGGLGSDVIQGGDDDDTVYGSEGSDSVDGGSGNDVLTFIHANNGVHIGTGFVSSDMTTNYTTSPQTTYTGIEQVRGSLNADLIDISDGGVTDYRGLGGDDKFRLFYPAKPSLVSLYGGDGQDTLDMSTFSSYYAPVGAQVFVNFVPSGPINGQDPTGLATTDIEHIIGSMGGDTFMLKALPTNLTIDGNGSPYWSIDTVDFTLADQSISGSFSGITNIATFKGSSFDDTFDIVGAQTVYGNGGKDIFVARGSSTRFYGGSDPYTADTEIDTLDLTCLTNRATISAQSGGWSYPTSGYVSTSSGGDWFLGMDKIVIGNAGADIGNLSEVFKGQILGGSGDDKFIAVAGISFDGGSGHDTINFGASSVSMEFDGSRIVRGDASLSSVTNYEEVIGTSGNDVFRGGDGIIFHAGGGVNEFHTGRGGSTYIGNFPAYGGPQDVMICDTESTIYLGMNDGSGNYPQIRDGIGNVVSTVREVRGSTGDDLFILNTQTHSVPYIISGGGGTDTLKLIDNSHLDLTYGSFFTPGSPYTSAVISGFSRIVASSGTVIGSAGDEDLIGSGTANISGGAGNDEMWANGQSSAYGGSGNDIIHGIGSGTLSGDSGDDILYASATTTFISGGEGNDVIHAEGSSAYINDQYGINHIYASPSAEVHFNMGAYERLSAVKDVGGGIFEVDTASGTTFVQGASSIYLDAYGVTTPMQLYAGMNYIDGIYY